MPMHGYPSPNSGGASQPDNAVITGAGASQGGKLPSGKPGGTLTISRREAMALIAFDTEDNPTQAMNRARKETGLTHEQLSRLRSRATSARSKGFELKSEKHLFKPTNYDGDEEGLLGKKEMDGDLKAKGGAKGKGAKAAAKDASGKDAKARKPVARVQLTKAQSQQAKAKPTVRETARMQEAWTRVHECDGDKFCGPCRQRQQEAARAKNAKAKRRGDRQVWV